MIGKFSTVLLILALAVSVFSVTLIFNSPERVSAGTDCVMGPDNCGCYLEIETDCQTHWAWTGTCDNGTPGVGYGYFTEFHKYAHFQNGNRISTYWGSTVTCLEIGIMPPHWYDWCDNTCGD